MLRAASAKVSHISVFNRILRELAHQFATHNPETTIMGAMQSFIKLIDYPLQRSPIQYAFEDQYDTLGREKDPPFRFGKAFETESPYAWLHRKYIDDIIAERLRIKEALNKIHDFHEDDYLEDFPLFTVEDFEDLLMCYKDMDSDKDGLIDFASVQNLLIKIGDETPNELRKLWFKQVDEDGSGSIDIEQFIAYVRVASDDVRMYVENMRADDHGMLNMRKSTTSRNVRHGRNAAELIQRVRKRRRERMTQNLNEKRKLDKAEALKEEQAAVEKAKSQEFKMDNEEEKMELIKQHPSALDLDLKEDIISGWSIENLLRNYFEEEFKIGRKLKKMSLFEQTKRHVF